MDSNVNQPAPPETVPEKGDPVSLFECATESLFEALMALIWGKIVFGIVGGIVGDMIPSLPPGMAGEKSPRHHHNGHDDSGGSWFASDTHQFWIVFALFFIVNLRAQMAGQLVTGAKKETRLHRAARRLREEGFGLLVTNAFGAMVAAWVASFVANFSWAQICIQWIFGAIAPTLNAWSTGLFGGAGVGAVQDWWNWWGDNQLKFSFWLFYIASICDDLGIPNLKTLARFSWRRARQRRRGRLMAASDPLRRKSAIRR